MISSSQIRAARAFLGIGQKELCKSLKIGLATLSDIENNQTNPKASTLNDLKKFFELNGVDFTSDGGIRPAQNIVHIYDGADCYLKLLDDVLSHLRQGDVLMKSAASDRRSNHVVIEKNEQIRAKGIAIRTLVEEGDRYLIGPLDEYRWMHHDLFVDGDVKLIYANKIAYLVTWLDTPRIIVIQDQTIADEQKRYFDFVWKQSAMPDYSIYVEQPK